MEPTTATTPLRPGFLTGLLAPAVAVLVGTLVALLAGVGPLSALRTGARAWLALQGSGIEVQGATLGLVPVGGVVLVAALTARVARTLTPDPLTSAGAFAATVAGTAGVVAAVLATVTGTTEVVVHPVRAAVAAFVVSGAGAALGATLPHGRAVDLLPDLLRRPPVPAVLRAAAAGAGALLAAAGVLVLGLLVLHVDRAAQLWALLDPGVGGALGLGALCLLAVPTLVVWTVSVLLGPGFVLGADTSLDLTGAQLGAVPGLPVLGGLPDPGVFPDVVVGLALLPLLAGLLAGWRVVPPDAAWRTVGRRTALGAAAGAVAGLAVGVLVGVSGGAVGPGRLAEAGPPVLTPLLVAVPVLAVGGALGALGAHYRGTRAQQPSERASRRPRLRFRHQPPGADRGDAGS